jgi:hypothetical protein
MSEPSLTDDAFLAALEDGSLPAAAFDHAAHVRAGYLYLKRRGFIGGMAAFRDSLRRFAARHGAPQKYHETITVAYLALIHDRIHAAPADEVWPDFAARNADLFARDLLHRYYQPETLSAPRAREVFLLQPRL